MNHVLPCYPSVHHHRTTRLTPSAVQSQLDLYLSASEAHAQHHPDAVLTPGGVTFSAASGPKGNITMTNLRRVARGLAGEDLAPTDEELAALEEARARSSGDKVWDGRGLAGIGNSKDRGAKGRGVLKKGSSFEEGEDEGWVDGEEYAAQQEVLEGEVGERDEATVVQQGEDAEQPEVEEGGKRQLTAAEKEERKAEKKRRHKEEQRKKAAERAAK